MKLRLGTRGSDLALTQSRWVASALAARGVSVELVTITTSGDRSTAPSFGAIGPQGVFVREIEQALLAREIDLAVHSFKDLPTSSPPDLIVAAIPARRDPADWLLYGIKCQTLNSDESCLARIPSGARLGTASARRRAWVGHFRPDLDVVSLRGNVPTRIRRLATGDYDAILLAGAGIERLNEASDLLADSLAVIERERLDPLEFVPAPAQGALAVQCRTGDADIRAAIATLDDVDTRAAVTLERAALALAEGGCDTAFGAFARRTAAGMELRVMTERDGRILASQVSGGTDDSLPARAIASLGARSMPETDPDSGGDPGRGSDPGRGRGGDPDRDPPRRR